MGSTAADERPPNGSVAEPVAPHQLAAQLHDGLSQELFAAELDLHELRCLPDLSPQAGELVERIGRRLSTGARQLRAALMATLDADPVGDPAPAVAEAIADLLECFARTHSIRTSLQVEGTGPDPSPAAAHVLLRAVREGLANVAKHARAGRVEVALRRDERRWSVEIVDDGSADPATVRSQLVAAGSFGLCSIRTDAARVGGRLSVEVANECGGVRLCVEVPVGPSADAERQAPGG